MIAGWLAGKLSGIIIFCIACAAIPLAIIAGVQTVRLDGFTFLWWHIVEGAIPARDAAIKARDRALTDLGTCHANVAGLEDKIAIQNGKIADLGKESADAKAKADAAYAALADARKSNAAKIAQIMAAKPGPDQCKSADDLILESLP